ncbi:MAG: isoleucine--tRNA ligase [Candidatus Micrarchaeia archaeon]
MSETRKDEEEILKYWEEHSILDKVRAKNSGNKPFYFLDGPPYVSGELHPGQIWVKAVKDIILRYKRFRGYDVHDRAGYDVHGLPTEHAVEKSMSIKSKRELESNLSVEKFITACREYVDSLISKMNRDYERFGISLNFEDAYIPYKSEYIEKAWGMLQRMEKKGLLYSDKKPLTYCPSCETVLAQGTLEVEYKDEEDPSLLIAFKINLPKSKPRIEIDDNTYLLVWTTTPWTIPANIAIAANPKELYVKAKFGGKHLILAKQRLDSIVSILNESAVVESEFYGSELEGIFYTSPIEDKVPMQKAFRRYHKVIFSESMVSMGEGSGLVHVAPGHGLEDYMLGKKNNLPVFSPISSHAKYTEEAGVYENLAVPIEANAKIIEDLRASGALLDSGKLTHSYPHCWRCDSKLIYLATDQWFLNIKKVKKKLLKNNSKVSWHPKEAAQWHENVLSNSPDWCISRQRYWGIPLPIWKCSKCEEVRIIGSKKELQEHAINKEYVESMQDLHRPYIDNVVLKCSKCAGEMHRVNDVFDVWFDSSVSFEASLSEEEFKRLFPADLILEGIDQLRGWFSSMLKSSVMLYGKSPYKEVVVDGMLLAEDGREMHKHLGNYISLSELLKFTTADAYRLWCSSHTQWLDLPFNRAEISDADKLLNILYNIANLINEYSDAIGYKNESAKIPSKIDGANEWIISRLHTVIKTVNDSLDRFEVQLATNALRDFAANDFSRFYIKIAKKNILYGSKSTANATIATMRYVFYNLIILISPIAPFASEKIYLENFAYKESIFLDEWPKYKSRLVNEQLEKDFSIAVEAITAILSSREKAKVKLRWPLSKAIIEVTDEEAYTAIEKLSGLIEEYTNIKGIELKRVTGISKIIKPMFQNIGPDFKENAGAVAEALKNANPKELEERIAEEGSYPLHTSKGLLSIFPRHFAIIEMQEPGDAVKFSHGLATVEKEISKELLSEALFRELARRIQLMRKELGLKKVDKIELFYNATGELAAIMKSKGKDLAREVNAVKVVDSIDGNEAKEFEIENEKINIAIKKV